MKSFKTRMLAFAAAIALVASLGIGMLQPSGADARSTSFTCTTLEKMFLAADAAGMTSTSLFLQGLYLDLDCNTIDLTGGAA